jgi:hypothetical protein
MDFEVENEWREELPHTYYGDLYERRKSTKIKNVFFLHFLIFNIILHNLSKILAICLINNNGIR